MRTIFFLLLSLLFLNSCTTTEPENKFTFTPEDASCTEAWLNIEANGSVTIEREGAEPKQVEVNGNYTFYEEGLKPNTEYNYTATTGDKKLTTKITTLDTTSNNFTWQSWNFGSEVGSCRLYDAAIINENDIWAVGEILLPDTNENGFSLYNAIHWDGSEWEFFKIPIKDYGDFITIAQLRTIFAFSGDNVWFASYADLIKWNGEKFESKAFFMESIPFNGQVNKLWGGSENDLYCVGNGGAIYLYNGTTWTKIETGTDLPFVDIYGAANSETGKEEILAVCNRNYPAGKRLYKIEGNTATEISLVIPNYQAADIDGLWFVPNRRYYIAGNGIYEKKSLEDAEWTGKPLEVSRYAKTSIRGNGLNDIFCVGAFGEILHYNGIRWKSFMDETGWFDGAYNNVDVKGNIIVATGGEGQQAKILIGKR
ncbi:MAG: glucosyl transferase [Ignavibacteria bacterium]|nr:glucosyl transferase [Ignavibacteria bacterium]